MSSISFSEGKIQLCFTVYDVWMLSECNRLWQTMKTEKTKNVYRKSERRNDRVLNSLVRRQIFVSLDLMEELKLNELAGLATKFPKKIYFTIDKKYPKVYNPSGANSMHINTISKSYKRRSTTTYCILEILFPLLCLRISILSLLIKFRPQYNSANSIITNLNF